MPIPPETVPIPNPDLSREPRAFPFSKQYASIQQIIDTGRGYAANVLGQPGTIYRLSPNVSGDWLQDATVVATNFPAIRKVVQGGLAMETHEGMGLVYYNVVCDLNYMLTGDVWYQTDPYYGEGATLVDYSTEEFVGFCLVNHPFAKPAYAIQLQRFAHIYRPQTGVDSSGYAQTYQQDMFSLTISGGQAVLLPDAQPNWVPIGLQPVSRPKGEQLKPYVPGLTEITEYFCYVPPIRGYEPMEGDIIQTLNGSRYVVIIPWHLEMGIVGNSMLVRRVNAQVQNSGPI